MRKIIAGAIAAVVLAPVAFKGFQSVRCTSAQNSAEQAQSNYEAALAVQKSQHESGRFDLDSDVAVNRKYNETRATLHRVEAACRN